MRRITNVSWPGSWWKPFVVNRRGVLDVSYEGQSSIDWPLRLKNPNTIFLSTDWMSPIYPMEWQSLALSVMILATNHIFLTATPGWKNLFSMLAQIDDLGFPAILVPSDITFTRAIERANRHQGKFNLSRNIRVVAENTLAKNPPAKELAPFSRITSLPWLPNNIFFGLIVDSVEAAQTAAVVLTNVRRRWPGIRLWINQLPCYEAIDWEKLGLGRDIVDWIVWGGGGPREGADLVTDFGRKTGTSVYINETTEGHLWGPQETPYIAGVLV